MPQRTDINTLEYDETLCSGCGMCSTVCPHGVFEVNGDKARLVGRESCMECGACQVNCPTGAIRVDSGVGCAAAMIWAALSRRAEPTCGSSSDQSPPCCSSDDQSPPCCCG